MPASVQDQSLQGTRVQAAQVPAPHQAVPIWMQLLEQVNAIHTGRDNGERGRVGVVVVAV